jgi:hypothetical protein
LIKTTQGQIREAEKNKAVADAALGELERAKADLAAEKQKREALETILNDKSKTTESTRKAYQDALNKPAPTVPVDSSTDDSVPARSKVRDRMPQLTKPRACVLLCRKHSRSWRRRRLTSRRRKLLAAQDEELKAAKDAFNAAKSEATAAEKTLEIADRAIAAQGRAMDAQEKAINNLLAISEKKDAQIDKLVARVDSANKRGMFGTLAGLALGIAARVF